MTTQLLVFAQSNAFIGKIKQYFLNEERQEAQLLQAIVELQRPDFAEHLDKRMDWKGFLTTEGGQLEFIGIIYDGDQKHRDDMTRFDVMPLQIYGAASPPGSLKVIHTTWARSADTRRTIKKMVAKLRFLNIVDSDTAKGVQAEKAAAQNRQVPVGRWANGLLGGSGMIQRQYLIGGRGATDEYHSFDGAENDGAIRF